MGLMNQSQEADFQRAITHRFVVGCVIVERPRLSDFPKYFD